MALDTNPVSAAPVGQMHGHWSAGHHGCNEFGVGNLSLDQIHTGSGEICREAIELPAENGYTQAACE